MANATAIWLEATADSMAEICSTTLAMEMRRDADVPKLPENLTGCFVALVGEEQSLQVGLASNAEGCKILAQALFGDENELSESDVNDALGEIANILAGGVKLRMASTHGGLSLGLPIVLEGHIRVSERQQIGQLDIAMNEVPARLLVVCNQRLTS